MYYTLKAVFYILLSVGTNKLADTMLDVILQPAGILFFSHLFPKSNRVICMNNGEQYKYLCLKICVYFTGVHDQEVAHLRETGNIFYTKLTDLHFSFIFL